LNDWSAVAAAYVELLLEGDSDEAIATAERLLAAGTTPTGFFEGCISPALQEIGRRFETLDVFLPEMVLAAEVVEEVNAKVIRPAIENDPDSSGGDSPGGLGKVCIATVQGDLHDIGKNMVSLILQVNGFGVMDLGTNVPPREIVEAAEREGADIIGLSSLLTSCLPYMKDVVEYLDGKGNRDKYAVIVGGAAPTPEFTVDMGADAHGHTAAEAVRICNQIMTGIKL